MDPKFGFPCYFTHMYPIYNKGSILRIPINKGRGPMAPT